jgi:site-specific recombinase
LAIVDEVIRTLRIGSPQEVLAGIPDRADPSDHVWLHDLLDWTLSAPPQDRTRRLTQLTEALMAHPERAHMEQRLCEMWQHESAARVLAEAGLPDEVVFLHELSSRLLRYIIPSEESEGDLYALLDSLDLSEADARWLAKLPPPLLEYWSGILAPGKVAVAEAAKLLGARAAGVALSRDLVRLCGPIFEIESPFFDLLSTVSAVAAHPDGASRQDWANCRSSCLQAVQGIYRAVEQRGASAPTVFRLRYLTASLRRIDTLIKILADESVNQSLTLDVVRGFAEQRGIANLIRITTRRLSRKVVEQAGRVGEHYVARNRDEWRVMGYGALGAGVLTAFTALFKYGLSSFSGAPLLVGVAHSANYAGSFILMQLLGLLLASKMPAATGAKLAMNDGEDDATQNEARLQLIASITSTQFVVTIGNILGAVPMAFVLDRFWIFTHGTPFLSAAVAEHGIEQLHPLFSLTIPYAILTGVFLWMSSLVTGWTANWMAFRNLAPAIRNSFRLRRTIGPGTAARIAAFVDHNLPGIAGYACLGVLLGFVPVFFTLWGIPLEVRHVTLAAASLTYHADRLLFDGTLHLGEFLMAALGVIIVGVLNFGTSFSVGLLVAARAREVKRSAETALARAVFDEFRKRPGRFFIPEMPVSAVDQSQPQTAGTEGTGL